MPSEYLEDIAMPGHRDRPAMSLGDRLWLIAARNRQTIEKLWDRLTSATTIIGGYGCIDGDLLEEDGVPETLVSHWRTIDYTDAGERIVSIPGGMIARDLALLGLGREAVEQGTVITPQRRPAVGRQRPASRPATPAWANTPHEPLVIRWRGKAVSRGT